MKKDSDKTNDQLIEELERLLKISKGQEAELLASKLRLEAQNQQLNATEQQLRSANQQLKAIEATYKKQNDFLNKIMESLSHPFCVIDANDYSVLLANSASGFDSTIKETTCYSLTHHSNKPCHTNDHICPLSEVKRKKTSVITEHIHYDKNGKKRYVEIHGHPIFDKTGNVVQMIEYALDITDRKEAEVSLNAANQQLKAYNQQLLASEQQQRNTRNQYEASNQQLIATEQQLKAINQQLTASQNKYRMLFYQMLDAFAYHQIITDENGKAIDYMFLEVNKAFENMTGLYANAIVGKKVTDVLPGIENDPVDWIGIYGDVALSGNEHRMEQFSEVLGKWYSVYAYCPARGYFVSIFEDITVRKMAEFRLRILSTAVNQSPVVVIITTPAGTIQYCNPKFTQVTGYSIEEAVGQNPRMLKSGEHSEGFYKDLWNTITSGNDWTGELHNKKKNGELFWESTLISPIRDESGEIIHFISIKQDISDRKRNEQIQHIIQNISNAVLTDISLGEFLSVIKTELGTVIDVSNFFIALYNEHADTFDLIFHKDKHDHYNEFPAGKSLTSYVVKTREPLLATESVIDKLSRTGEIEIIGTSAKVWLGVPMFSKGKILGVIAVQSYENEAAYNSSDMWTLEIISQQISVSLERKKAEEDLKKALEKAQESDRLKSAFLANMSHEIRTPMNGILGFTQLLKDPHLSGKDLHLYIDIINRSGNRLLNTINDIIDISKIEAGQAKVINSEVIVNAVLKAQYYFFHPQAEDKGIDLVYETSLSDEESRIRVDQHKLESILTNLIKNSIKYTDKGKITLGCTAKEKEGKKFLEFYVKDTGIGIPPNRIQAVFNRFEQADIADTRAYQGSGLGLTIAKSYVEMLGGTIWVETEEGIGSTFSFTIPIEGADHKEITPIQPSEFHSATSFKDLSVIIAEDDESNQLLYKIIFSDLFEKIIFTVTGRETIEKCRLNPDINVILMDIKMPDINGYEATREIRKFNMDVIIIAQTAYGLAGDKDKALEAGCNDYIAKPAKRGALLEIIQKNIDKRMYDR